MLKGFVWMVCLAALLIGVVRAVAARLPNHGQIAYLRAQPNARDIWLLDVRGGQQHNLTRHIPASITAFQWLPDGRELLILTVEILPFAPRQGFSLLRVPGGAYAPFAPLPECTGCTTFDYDAERGTIVYSQGMFSPRQSVFTLSSRSARYIADGVNGDWSPDGRQIVYEKTNEPDAYPLIILDTQDGTVQRFSYHNLSLVAPDWSPEGRYLVAAGIFGANYVTHDLYVVDITCGPDCEPFPRRLTYAPELEYSPAWSPDGRQVAYRCATITTSNICVINADGTGARQLTENLLAGAPAWRPRRGG
jgi:TolB protein